MPIILLTVKFLVKKEKQLEVDNLYAQYLMILYMKETMKKNFKFEEDLSMVYFNQFLILKSFLLILIFS